MWILRISKVFVGCARHGDFVDCDVAFVCKRTQRTVAESCIKRLAKRRSVGV